MAFGMLQQINAKKLTMVLNVLTKILAVSEGTFFKSEGSCLPAKAQCVRGKITKTTSDGAAFWEENTYGLWMVKNVIKLNLAHLCPHIG